MLGICIVFLLKSLKKRKQRKEEKIRKTYKKIIILKVEFVDELFRKIGKYLVLWFFLISLNDFFLLIRLNTTMQ